MNTKSPIHYMGNKYELLQDLKAYFPDKEECKIFIDLFGGSGCVSLNVNYDNIIYNELNTNIYNLLKMFKEYKSEDIIAHIQRRIKEFDLPISSDDIRGKDTNSFSVKKREESYNKFRKFYNNSERNIIDLYTITFFSFSNMIRFNAKSEFNMPYGNQYFSKDNQNLIKSACYSMREKNITFLNKSAFDILKDIKKGDKLFIYLDPPYSNTTAVYNEQRAFGGWTIEDDLKLFNELDRLNDLGIKWAFSNVLESKGKYNTHIKEWADKSHYKIIYLDKNYASLGKGNANSVEILVINYKPKYEQMTLF